MNKKRKIVLFSLLTTAAAIATAVTVAGKGSAFEVPAEGCTHEGTVNHHEKVEPTLLKSGVKEYWCCCDCHKSFEDSALTKQIANTEGDPSEVTDGRYLAPLGETFKGSPMNPEYSSDVSAELPPEGYAFEKVYHMNKGGQFVLNNIYLGDVEEVGFSIKAGCWHIYIDSSWNYCGAPNVWTNYKLVQTATNIWDVYQQNMGADLVLKKSGASGSCLQDIFVLNGDSSDYYITNLRFATTQGKIAEESALEKPSIGNGEVILPMGYNILTKQEITNATALNESGGKFLAYIDMAQFKSVKFAFMTTNRQYCDSSWGNPLKKDVWNFAEVINNLDGTYTSKIYNEKHVYKFGYTASTFRNAFTYANYGGEIPVWYSTEVVGILKEGVTTDGELISKSAICSNSVVYTETILCAPAGFQHVNKLSVAGSRWDTRYYFAQDVSGYSYVTFAIKNDNYLLYDGWAGYSDTKLWTIVVVEHVGAGNFNVTFKDTTGATKYTETNLDCTGVADTGYVAKALNQIMFKAATYSDSATDNFYVTDLRGVLAD